MHFVHVIKRSVELPASEKVDRKVGALRPSPIPPYMILMSSRRRYHAYKDGR
jgi:hypothetical protein